ncbi:cellulose binding domain-containing protein [Actinoplanes bogorensis]|uniref:Cellulose binding domain-containing protein n=1 Tax=Paractinoplanes bogorensis TaxID=1610840 RepID=A0ABS5YJ47_9ACTN|nr:beta-1,3-glucanase family protein [Actinoplanes bogorensis]MBU2662734.1 cellulose binding domain-containing protein [Actinoplanes bogorensis]
MRHRRTLRHKRTIVLSTAAAVLVGATTWLALPASAAAPTATLRTVSDWGSGWQSEVTIKNTGADAMSSWKVEFDLPAGGAIGSFWDTNLKVAGSHLTFSNRDWNGSLGVDASVTFGFVGSGGKPANCKLNGMPCEGNGEVIPTTPPTVAPTTQAPTAAPTTQAPPATTKPAEPTSEPKEDVPPKSDILPVKVTNDTGRGENVFLYMLGTNLNTGKLGYVNAAGAFTDWTGGASTPVPAPDVSIPGPANGSSVTIKMPKNLSGRLYMSFGQKLDFRLTNDGLVQPAPWAGADPNRDILFDWSEFTLNDGGLFINSSQVDMFAVPHAVSVTGGDGRTLTTGAVKPGGRQRVIDAIKAAPDFAKSVVTRGDGTVLRVLAPGKAADAGLMNPTYLDSYITKSWNAYTNKNLTVVPFGDRPDTKFFGRTSGNVMNFTDTSGKTVASFNKPSTANVWGCDGALGAPNDLVVGPIARTLCAALTRNTLDRLDVQPSGTAADFYQGDTPNVYGKVIHDNMVDGRAYAFAFDDVQAQESLVHSGDPRLAGITLSPF